MYVLVALKLANRESGGQLLTIEAVPDGRIYLPVKRPWLGKSLDQVRPRLSELIVQVPSTADPRRPPRCTSLERKKCNDVSSICVIHLLIGRVGRSPKPLVEVCLPEVFYVRENTIRCILDTAQVCDVRGDACIDDQVFLAGVGRDGDAAENKKTATGV